VRGNTNAGAFGSQRWYDSPSPETDLALAFEVEPAVESCIDSTRKLLASRTPVRMASIFDDGRDQDPEQIGQMRQTKGGSVEDEQKRNTLRKQASTHTIFTETRLAPEHNELQAMMKHAP